MGLLKWENTKLQLQEHERLLHAVRSDIQSVQNVVNQRPRDAGYPWETAPFVLIDDGLDLDPFPLPKDLCASPSVSRVGAWDGTSAHSCCRTSDRSLRSNIVLGICQAFARFSTITFNSGTGMSLGL